MNYMKLLGFAAFAIGAILYLASGDDHVIVVGKQNYDLGEYVKISDNSSSNVIVRVGEEYSLDIDADERDIALLRIYVKGHTLVIEKRKGMLETWHGDIPKFTITLPKLKKYTVNGGSDVEIEGIHGSIFKAVVNGSGGIMFEGESEELVAKVNGSGELNGPSYDAHESKVVLNGSGTVALSGNCGSLEVEINGSGSFEGRNYECETVEVDILGSGSLEVHAREMVDVDVMGSGRVNIYGDPDRVKDRSHKKNHIVIH
ncbi:MAG: DUF2807 domain-containing protein [Emcibacter sp.]|nr:DUF2807 domain-containing protein [Emcibacter sp.]